MTATERLRELLDERGVDWWSEDDPEEPSYYFITKWFANGCEQTYEEIPAIRSRSLKAYCITPEQAIVATLGPRVTGDTSDGYHTFDELYHHRAVLFSVITRVFPHRSWKSRRHHDGTMYDGMFIVGIETDQGQATYHYDLDPYWELFDCEELYRAPEWDGHTPDDAIRRIATLRLRECELTVSGPWGHPYVCSACGAAFDADVLHGELRFCPNCGSKDVGE